MAIDATMRPGARSYSLAESIVEGQRISRDSQVWLYEVIRLEVGKALPKVLESGFAPKSEATRENARKILKARSRITTGRAQTAV